jgi:hypothetical protein
MGKKDQLPPGTTRVNGSDGWITFDGEYLTITHKWMSNVGRGEARFPLGAVAGVTVKNGMVLSAVTIVVPGVVPIKGNKNPLTVNGIYKDEAASFRDLVVTALGLVDAAPMPELGPPYAPDPADAEPAAAASTLVDQLKELAALHAQGMLTPEEFGIAKARLLGTAPPQDLDDGW